MINNERIVPIQNTDLLSMYGVILILSSISVIALAANDPEGDFTQTTNSATVLCNEPVKSFDFGESVTAGTVYFVPGLNYTGFSIDGTATETAGDDVTADGTTLYSATLADSTVTIAKIGF